MRSWMILVHFYGDKIPFPLIILFILSKGSPLRLSGSPNTRRVNPPEAGKLCARKKSFCMRLKRAKNPACHGETRRNKKGRDSVVAQFFPAKLLNEGFLPFVRGTYGVVLGIELIIFLYFMSGGVITSAERIFARHYRNRWLFCPGQEREHGRRGPTLRAR